MFWSTQPATMEKQKRRTKTAAWWTFTEGKGREGQRMAICQWAPPAADENTRPWLLAKTPSPADQTIRKLRGSQCWAPFPHKRHDACQPHKHRRQPAPNTLRRKARVAAQGTKGNQSRTTPMTEQAAMPGRNTRREEQVTVLGPERKPMKDVMLHRWGGGIRLTRQPRRPRGHKMGQGTGKLET